MCVCVCVCLCVCREPAYYAYALFYKALCYGLQHFIQYSDRDLIKETFFSNFQNSNIVYDKCTSRRLEHYDCVLPDSPSWTRLAISSTCVWHFTRHIFYNVWPPHNKPFCKCFSTLFFSFYFKWKILISKQPINNNSHFLKHGRF